MARMLPENSAKTTAEPESKQGWQAEKSAIMRRQILQAALICIVKNGYHGTTMANIAREAGVSTGAMVHHFANKAQLIAAAIDYLSEERIADYRSRIEKIAPGADRARQGLEIYWDHLTDPRFSAFYELLLGARSNEDLKHLVVPAIRNFEEEWYRSINELFPEWQGTGPIFDLAMDLTQFLYEGMVLHTLIDPSPDRYRRLRVYVNNRLRELLEIASRLDAEVAVKKYLEGNPIPLSSGM